MVGVGDQEGAEEGEGLNRWLLSTVLLLLPTFPLSFLWCGFSPTVLFLLDFSLPVFDVLFVVALTSALFFKASFPALFLARAIFLMLCKLSGGGVSSSPSSPFPSPSVFISSLSLCSKLATGWRLNPRPSWADCRSNPRPPATLSGTVSTTGLRSSPLASLTGCKLKPGASAGCRSNPRPSISVGATGLRSTPRGSKGPDANPMWTLSTLEPISWLLSCNDPMNALPSLTGLNPKPRASSTEANELALFPCAVVMVLLVPRQSSVTTTGWRLNPRARVSPWSFFSMMICPSLNSWPWMTLDVGGRSKLPGKRMMYIQWVTQANSKKGNPSAPIRSRTYDLPITSSEIPSAPISSRTYDLPITSSEIPSAPIRNRTYDLPITSSDVLPLSYRRLVGVKAIKLH